MRSLALTAASLAFALASAGCAVIAAKAPDPDRPRDQPPMCNDGKGGVVVDGLMTTTLGIVALAMASDGEGEAAAITGLGALAYGISAGVGSSSANKCRAAMEEYVTYRERDDAEADLAREDAEARRPTGAIGGMPIAPYDEEQQPVVATPPQPRPQPAAQPQPVAQPQPQPQPPVARTTPRREPESSGGGGGDDGDWSDFWKEVP